MYIRITGPVKSKHGKYLPFGKEFEVCDTFSDGYTVFYAPPHGITTIGYVPKLHCEIAEVRNKSEDHMPTWSSIDARQAVIDQQQKELDRDREALNKLPFTAEQYSAVVSQLRQSPGRTKNLIGIETFYFSVFNDTVQIHKGFGIKLCGLFQVYWSTHESAEAALRQVKPHLVIKAVEYEQNL